jgi:hypothetical protein
VAKEILVRYLAIVLSSLVLAILVVQCAWGQDPQESVSQEVQDELLDELVGNWTMIGSIRGEPVTYSMKGTWVLGHQFVLLKMSDKAVPSQYEASVFIGKSRGDTTYVVHWLDSFGGEPSKILGYGERSDNKIVLTFQYPSGTFRDTFSYESGVKKWHFLIEAESENGAWDVFADYEVIPQ